MNITGSQCSSSCESGWTMYLDQHTYSMEQYNNDGDDSPGKKVVFSGEDEGLSMLSDASSGPPHCYSHDDVEDWYNNVQTDHNDCFYHSSSAFEVSNAKQKIKKRTQDRKREENQSCYLDDTASSPAVNFPIEKVRSNNNRTSMEHVPAGISETHFKGKSVLGFLKSSGKAPVSEKCGGVKGRKWQ